MTTARKWHLARTGEMEEGLAVGKTRGAFAEAMGRPALAPRLQAIRDQFQTPEEINDSPTTAPSKRVLEILPYFEKPLIGSRAARQIGLAVIARECRHFGSWIQRLEALGERVEA